MRAALFQEPGQPLTIVENIDVEEPRHNEVLVKVSHCGICHSDLSLMGGPPAHPMILGHEAAGVVEAVGPDVTTCAVGDSVMLTPLAPCGSCYWCVRSQPTLCKDAQTFTAGTRPDGTTPFSLDGGPVLRGLGVGGFGEYTLVTETGVARLEPDVPLDVACLVGCSVQTGVGAVLNTADVEAGATVLVTGLGGIGQAVVQGAVVAGASKIIVSDPVEARREAATGFGATMAIDPNDTDVMAAVFEDTEGIGVDYAFEAAGVAALTETCINASRIGGTTVVVGADATLASASFMPVLMATHGKRIIGSLLGDCHSQRDITRLVGLWQAGRLDLEGMVSHRVQLDDINDGFDHMRETAGIRTVVQIG